MSTKGKILVVDDDMDIVSTLKDILELEDFEVDNAYNGQEAVKAAGNMKYDIVLMDIKMPVMNGVDALKIIKKESPDTPVIMISAYAVEELVNEALRAGAFATISKPVNFELLFDTIKKAATSLTKVLILEDDSDTREILRRTLERQECNVMLATDSDEAIELCRLNRFDLMVVDIKLPTIDGVQTLREISQIRPETAIILISGYRDEIDKYRNEPGIRYCFLKPVEPVDLARVVNEIRDLNYN